MKQTLSFLFLFSLQAHAAHVLIDPGHGGRDRGAQVQDVYESDVVWPWALSLKRELVKQGLTVSLSRQETTAPGSLRRKELFASQEFDLIISLHANYFVDPKVKGLEYFIRNPLPLEDRKLQLAFEEKSESLVNTIVRDLKRQAQLKISLGYAQRLQKVWPGKIQQGSFDVLEVSAAPALLIELGYLSNVLDRAQMRDSTFITTQSQKMARVIKESLFDGQDPVF